MNNFEIIATYDRHVNEAAITFASELTPEDLLDGKFYRTDIDSSDRKCFVTYLSDDDPDIEITIAIRLNETVYPMIVEIAKSDYDPMTYTMECTDFTISNIRAEVKNAYDDFVRTLA